VFTDAADLALVSRHRWSGTGQRTVVWPKIARAVATMRPCRHHRPVLPTTSRWLR
jgi:hypothetical protein